MKYIVFVLILLSANVNAVQPDSVTKFQDTYAELLKMEPIAPIDFSKYDFKEIEIIPRGEYMYRIEKLPPAKLAHGVQKILATCLSINEKGVDHSDRNFDMKIQYLSLCKQLDNKFIMLMLDK